MQDTSTAIYTSIRQALAQPSVRVGQRLLSERQLANHLRVPHAQVRKSLLHLVDEGLLVQKRGSGTFVRRLPAPPESSESPESPTITGQASNAQPIPLTAGQLLHPSDAQASPQARSNSTTSYNLGLWWNNLEMMTPVQQIVLAAMVDQAESLGHRLSFHSVARPHSREPLDVDILKQRVLAHRNDGCLCTGWCDSAFHRFLVEEMKLPAVFFDTVFNRRLISPYVVMDNLASQEIACHRLNQSGCRNIWEIQLNHHRPLAHEEGVHVSSTEGTWRWLRLNTFDIHAVCEQIRLWLGRHGRQNIDGLYISDDHLLPGVSAALDQAGLRPGRDVAVISRANKGLKLPWPPGSWSVLESDPAMLGRTAIDLLLQRLTSHEGQPASLALQPTWRPGESHRLVR